MPPITDDLIMDNRTPWQREADKLLEIGVDRLRGGIGAVRPLEDRISQIPPGIPQDDIAGLGDEAFGNRDASNALAQARQRRNILEGARHLNQSQQNALRVGALSIEDAIAIENAGRAASAQAGADAWLDENMAAGRQLAEENTAAELMRRPMEGESDAERAIRISGANRMQREQKQHEGSIQAQRARAMALGGFDAGARETPHVTTAERGAAIAKLLGDPLAAAQFAKDTGSTAGGFTGVFNPIEVASDAIISGPTAMQYGSVDPSRVRLGGRTGSDRTDILPHPSTGGLRVQPDGSFITRNEAKRRKARDRDIQRIQMEAIAESQKGKRRFFKVRNMGEFMMTKADKLGIKGDRSQVSDYLNRLLEKPVADRSAQERDLLKDMTIAHNIYTETRREHDHDSRRKSAASLAAARAARAGTLRGQGGARRARMRQARQALIAPFTSGSGVRAWALPIPNQQQMDPAVMAEIVRGRTQRDIAASQAAGQKGLSDELMADSLRQKTWDQATSMAGPSPTVEDIVDIYDELMRARGQSGAPLPSAAPPPPAAPPSRTPTSGSASGTM